MSEIMFYTSFVSFEYKQKCNLKIDIGHTFIYQSTFPTQHKPAVDINDKIKIAK